MTTMPTSFEVGRMANYHSHRHAPIMRNSVPVKSTRWVSCGSQDQKNYQMTTRPYHSLEATGDAARPAIDESESRGWICHPS